MVEHRLLLVRRDAQRKLSLAIAFFLAIPILVLGYMFVVWYALSWFPGDCFRPDCPTTQPEHVPPFFIPVLVAIACLAIAALLLYFFTYRSPRTAWTIVGVIAVVLIAVALGIDLVYVLRWDVALITFVWPMAPGLMAVDAAWRSRRSPGSS